MSATSSTIRVVTPFHLRTLAKVTGEVQLDVPAPVTPRTILDALEARYPVLRGTIRELETGKRRPLLRFFACEEDVSFESLDVTLPEAIASGKEPFFVVGAIAGGAESRRQYLSLAAMDPATVQLTAEVQLSFERMQTVGRRGLGHAKECGLIVPSILKSPTAIFEGLTRDEDEDHRGYGWRCYCGIPAEAYRTDGTARRTYPGQVYLVFVNDDGIAYNWRWERADPDDPSLPIDHASRFRKRLQ